MIKRTLSPAEDIYYKSAQSITTEETLFVPTSSSHAFKKAGAVMESTLPQSLICSLPDRFRNVEEKSPSSYEFCLDSSTETLGSDVIFHICTCFMSSLSFAICFGVSFENIFSSRSSRYFDRN